MSSEIAQCSIDERQVKLESIIPDNIALDNQLLSRYFYVFEVSGSRRNKFIKYLKTLFPEYALLKYNLDCISDEELNKPFNQFRYGKYNDLKRYPAKKLRQHINHTYAYVFAIPAEEWGSNKIFTLFELKGIQPDFLRGYSINLLEFFDQIPDVYCFSKPFKKHHNIELNITKRKRYTIRKAKYLKVEDVECTCPLLLYLTNCDEFLPKTALQMDLNNI